MCLDECGELTLSALLEKPFWSERDHHWQVLSDNDLACAGVRMSSMRCQWRSQIIILLYARDS